MDHRVNWREQSDATIRANCQFCCTVLASVCRFGRRSLASLALVLSQWCGFCPTDESKRWNERQFIGDFFSIYFTMIFSANLSHRITIYCLRSTARRPANWYHSLFHLSTTTCENKRSVWNIQTNERTNQQTSRHFRIASSIPSRWYRTPINALTTSSFVSSFTQSRHSSSYDAKLGGNTARSVSLNTDASTITESFTCTRTS